MRKKLFVSMAAALCLFVLVVSAASAHVVVYPQATTQGAYEVFTVRVPVESEQATTKVEVKIPPQAAISRVKPLAGWTYAFEKDADGLVTAVIWTAADGGLKDGEFGEFSMQGKVADDAAEIVWKAYQTSADGTVVEWTGAEDADKPASITTVAAGSGGDDHHSGAAAASETESSDSSNDTTPLVLSILALAVAFCALWIALSPRSRKSIKK